MDTETTTQTVRHTTQACMFCDQCSTVELTSAEATAWRAGVVIQGAMPDRSIPERELIRSGIHPECWAENLG